ncbi:MAG: Mov34/MPN/PAD-1 family protein [Nitrosopumilus sp.]
MDRIILSNLLRELLVEHAQKEKPNESCALLFGKNNVVSEIFLTKNIEESPVNFTISNEQLLRAYRVAEGKKIEVIGIFHSHPNSDAYPSNTDKKFMHSNPVVWMIYSNTNDDFRAYILDSEVTEIPIQEE